MICRYAGHSGKHGWNIEKINEHQLSIEMCVCGRYGSSPKRVILRAVAAEPCEEMMEWITFYDWLIGGIFVALWVLGHAVIGLLLRKGNLPRASWKEAYEANQEPYAPVFECTTCQERWLCSQATHQRQVTQEELIWCPKCNENRLSKIKKHYYTPGCKNFTEPLVHRPKFKDFVRAPQHLQCGQQQHADDFNGKFHRPAAKAAAAAADTEPPELN